MKLKLDSGRMFQDNLVPRGTRLAGWAAIVHALDLPVPVRQPACVSEQHVSGSRRVQDGWTILDKRYWPGGDFVSHLTFALRREALDLVILKRAFEAVRQDVMESWVRDAPASASARRAWYLFELLTGRTLDVGGVLNMPAVDVLDSRAHFAGKPRLSKRHRVRDNLLGTAAFCPVIRRTPALTSHLALDLAATARKLIGRTSAHVAARAAGFLLLADSKASFEIEGEHPPRTRLERWGRAVLQTGKGPLTLDEIVGVHRLLIEDNRFVRPGLRPDGVFLGRRDFSGEPLPEFIGARADDLPELMKGLLEADDRMREDEIDPVLNAAATSFGFVYVHPFQDGNGRMHRWLIHHVLTERRFSPPGIIFPISPVMLDRIDDYRKTLEAHSGALMPFIEWRATADRNVEVLNRTADFYRYFDCTLNAEFLYACVQRTVEQDLPQEIEYLQRNDEAVRRIRDAVEMPERTAANLIVYIRQNGGTLSKKRRSGEFRALTDTELSLIQHIVQDCGML